MDLENTGKDDWMDEAPLLSAMNRKNPFTVPQDYFSELPSLISTRCLIEDHRFSEAEEFTVPEGYFDSLSSQIEGRIAEENLRSMITEDGFTVPPDYFSGLEQRILAKTQRREETVQPFIKPIRSQKSWIQYAAAACVTVILGSVLVFNNQNKSIESRIGEIPEQEIINYLQLHSDMGDTPVIMESVGNVNMGNIGSDVSEAQLEEYINTTL
jgi:hypothetical protein